VAQVVERLLSKHKTLSSTSNTAKKENPSEQSKECAELQTLQSTEVGAFELGGEENTGLEKHDKEFLMQFRKS
jgi:hypothetical protein